MLLLDAERGAHAGRTIENPAGPAYRAWLAAGAQRHSPDPHEMRDAAWECDHGRLPHDAHRDPNCRCWTTQPAEEAPMTTNDVLTLARETDALRRKDLVDTFGCTPDEATATLSELTDEGKLVAEGTRGGKRYLYAVAEAPIAPNDEPRDEQETIVDDLTARVYAYSGRPLSADDLRELAELNGEIDRLVDSPTDRAKLTERIVNMTKNPEPRVVLEIAPEPAVEPEINEAVRMVMADLDSRITSLERTIAEFTAERDDLASTRTVVFQTYADAIEQRNQIAA